MTQEPVSTSNRHRQPNQSPIPIQQTGLADRGLEFGLAAGTLLWLFLACCFPLVDTDFWWHLRAGEWMLAEGRIPSVDMFTFTNDGRPWIDLHWGFQLLITGLYQLGGVKLVTLAKAAVLTLAVAIAWSAGGPRLPVWLKSLLWIPAIVAISGRAYERPEMLTMLFLAIWLWIIENLDRRPWLIWVLPVVQVVWINCHALYVLGLVVGVCYGADYILRILWGQIATRSNSNEREFIQPAPAKVCVVGILVVLASLVNPYFTEGALFPLVLYRKFSADREIYKSIGEFQRPTDFFWHAFQKGGLPEALGNLYFSAEFGLWCLTALSFLWLALVRCGNIWRLFLFVMFSHLGWQATRNTNIFSLVCGTILCANCGSALVASGVRLSQGARRGLTLGVGALICALIFSVVTNRWAAWAKEDALTIENKTFKLGEAKAWFAHRAVKFAGQPGFPDRAFVAHIGQAAVYLYHNGPEHRVYLDPRLEVASPETFQNYNRICDLMARADRSWEEFELMRDARGELPVVILDSRFSRAMVNGLMNTPGWRMVFADGAAAVFLQNQVADRLGLSPANPLPLLLPPGTRVPKVPAQTGR